MKRHLVSEKRYLGYQRKRHCSILLLIQREVCWLSINHSRIYILMAVPDPANRRAGSKVSYTSAQSAIMPDLYMTGKVIRLRKGLQSYHR